MNTAVKKTEKIIGLFAATMLCASLLAAQTAQADEHLGNFTVYPTYMHGENENWIILDAVPGSVLRDFITLENLSDRPQTITLQATEAVETEDSYLVKDTSAPESFISWIKYDKSTYILNPGEKIRVPFEISVPESAAVKKLTGAILAAQSAKNNDGMNIVTRIGVRLYLNVVPPGTPLTNTISTAAAASAPFGLNSAPHNTYFILTSLLLAVSVTFTIINRKHEKKQA